MVTDNGACSLACTSDPRLNLFFKLVRNIEDENLLPLIDESWSSSKIDTMRILFQWRDCRGGKGDYMGFLKSLSHISEKYLDWVDVNIKNIPEYGRYLDLVILWHLVDIDSPLRDSIMKFVTDQLVKDIDKMKKEESVSLLAKWLPSENSKYDKYEKGKGGRFVVCLCKKLFNVQKVTSKHIQNLRINFITPLRKHIGIVESLMCNKDYINIDYEKVPSVAMNCYKKAFMKNDQQAFQQYIEDVKDNKANINAGQVYPHDLVRTYINDNFAPLDPVIEAQWQKIKKEVDDSGVFKNSAIVCDVSGSMGGTPMEVSIALGLLGMSMNNNRLITFSETPTLISIPPEESLHSQVSIVKNMPWGTNTDLIKVFDLIIDMDMDIEKLFIFSDMQFDEAIGNQGMTHLDILKERFGKKFPIIVFWNLDGNTNDYPACSNENNVMMLSGFSQSILKMVLNKNVEITPLNILYSIINNERYKQIASPK